MILHNNYYGIGIGNKVRGYSVQAMCVRVCVFVVMAGQLSRKVGVGLFDVCDQKLSTR